MQIKAILFNILANIIIKNVIKLKVQPKIKFKIRNNRYFILVFPKKKTNP